MKLDWLRIRDGALRIDLMSWWREEERQVGVQWSETVGDGPDGIIRSRCRETSPNPSLASEPTMGTAGEAKEARYLWEPVFLFLFGREPV